MRHSVLVGSAAAVLLIGVATALVVDRGGLISGGLTVPQLAAVSQSGPAAGVGEPAGLNLVPQPPHPAPPSFDVVKVGPTGTAVIAGRAEPGSKVTVRDGDKIIGEVTADKRGEWVLVPDRPIGPGDRVLSLDASLRPGGEVVKSDETVALSISPPAPGAQGGTALAVVLPRDGGGAARVLQRPDGSSSAHPGAAAPTTPNALSLDTVEYDPEGRVILSGRAKPGAAIQIYIGNEPIAAATADPAGAWSTTSKSAVRQGRLELRLDELGEGGRVAHRVTLPLATAIAARLAPGQSYVVQPGNNLWQIARLTYGNGVRYLIIYSANLGQIRDPGRIYPGQVFKIPKS